MKMLKTCASVAAIRPALYAALALAVAFLSTAQKVDAALVYALTDENDLLSFNSSDPATQLSGGAISGLATNDDLIGIDIRPSTGVLYAVGSSGIIYTINTTTFAATQIQQLNNGVSPLALSGTRFGFDFNPVADRLRIVSDTEQNLRVNVDTGLTLVDGALAYGTPTPNPSVVGAAYTNSLPGSGSTALYVLDSRNDALAIQNPPNAGVLTAVGSLTANVSALVGFDIYSTGFTNTGYAALQNIAMGISQFYSVNLATGGVSLVGEIGGGDLIDGLAVVSVPEPATFAMAGFGLAAALAVRRRNR